jgi:hypothetical protein
MFRAVEENHEGVKRMPTAKSGALSVTGASFCAIVSLTKQFNQVEALRR